MVWESTIHNCLYISKISHIENTFAPKKCTYRHRCKGKQKISTVQVFGNKMSNSVVRTAFKKKIIIFAQKKMKQTEK